MPSVKFTTLLRMRDGKMANGYRELPWKIDGVTGLPWFTTIHGEMAGRALTQDLHVVDIHLGGLSAVLDAHGAPAFASILREIGRRATDPLDDRDQLSRHTGDRLLLITTRPPAEVARLVEDVVARISAAGVRVDGTTVPRVAVGLARLLRASDYADAAARLDAAILSAEFNAAPVHAADGEQAPAPAPAEAQAVAPEAASREKRAVLTSLRLDLSGLVATAVVELTFGPRRIVARSVGRNTEGRRLFLIAEATARAVTDLLPSGYGAVIHDVTILQPGAPEQGRGILSSVLFLSPDNEQFLFGLAPAGNDPRLAAARASLSAVNRKIQPLLATSGA